MNDALTRARVLQEVHHFCGTISFVRPLERARNKAGGGRPQRLTQIATSFAWHAERPHPPERLEDGARELARLWNRAGCGDDGESGLYLLLLGKLELDEELQRLAAQITARQAELENSMRGEPDLRKRRQIERDQRPQLRELAEAKQLYEDTRQAIDKTRAGDKDRQPWSKLLIGILKLSEAEVTQWRPELRLRLALAAAQTLQNLLQSDPLQAQIKQLLGRKDGVFEWQ